MVITGVQEHAVKDSTINNKLPPSQGLIFNNEGMFVCKSWCHWLSNDPATLRQEYKTAVQGLFQ